MKRLCAFVLSSLAIGCSSPSPQSDRAPAATDAVSTHEGLREFDLDWARAMIKGDLNAGRNSFLSPLSVHMALALLDNGAGARTAQQLTQALRLPGSNLAALNDANRSVMDQLLSGARNYNASGRRGEPFQIVLANSVWYKGDLVIEKPFQAVLEGDYKAKIQALPAAADLAAKAINDWALQATAGKIGDIITPQILADSGFKMLLANALYVKGTWTQKFNALGAPTPFHALGGAATPTKMMTRTSTDSYYEDDRYLAVNLSTAGGLASMAIVMPKSTRGVPAFATAAGEVMSPKFWTALDGGFAPMRMHLTMPAFEIASSQKLNDSLKGLGIADAFDPARADFKGITRSAPLFVSYVKQDAKLKVDENGFEGAAVTSTGMATLSALPEAPKEVRIDRPFFFAIRDRATGSLLFVGTFLKP